MSAYAINIKRINTRKRIKRLLLQTKICDYTLLPEKVLKQYELLLVQPGVSEFCDMCLQRMCPYVLCLKAVSVYTSF